MHGGTGQDTIFPPSFVTLSFAFLLEHRFSPQKRLFKAKNRPFQEVKFCVINGLYWSDPVCFFTNGALGQAMPISRKRGLRSALRLRTLAIGDSALVIVSATARAWVLPRVLHRRRSYTGSTGGRNDDQGRRFAVRTGKPKRFQSGKSLGLFSVFN